METTYIKCKYWTLNPISGELDVEWIKVAKRRLAELRSGRVSAISGDEVFAKIRERFENC